METARRGEWTRESRRNMNESVKAWRAADTTGR